MNIQTQEANIKLKRVFIEYQLPEELQPLHELANNLWWSWDKEAEELFRSIDPANWEEEYGYNPIRMLESLSVERINELVEDEAFMKHLHGVNKRFRAYLAEQPAEGSPRIAYFSMEYGLHYSVRLYSGGLGILAGDYLKEASDSNVDMVAVGLLYRYGYFQQSISLHGDQISNYPPQKFTQLPVLPVRDRSGEWLKIDIQLPGRTVYAKVWEMKVGRISLHLLDTDLDENSWEDRSLTHQLYGGDNEHRLKQEMLLGIGGIRALQALDVRTDVYHINEGHAAFLGLERLRHLITEENMSFDQAREVVRASALFTTHTPVPAGHDYFPESLLRNYLFDYVSELGIDWQRFVALGRIDPLNSQEDFSMSHLAIRLSQEVNGVSELHGEVSRRMFTNLYPGYSATELHIGYVTNSVHYPSWIAREWNDLFIETFGAEFLSDQSNKNYWRGIYQVQPERIMTIRRQLKKALLDYVGAKLKTDLTRRGEKPGAIFDVLNHIQEDALVIGFARRFATYKRAHLLFANSERLAELVNDKERPVMFIFAGKAHPADRGGQDLIKRIVQVSQQPEFAGKIIFLEGYNMEMAKFLVQGVDIWLNTPTRPKEASGTSGMKAVLNGVVNFSVLDGWWAEGYRPDAGWSLPLERTYDDQRLQDELDAETIYNTLENEIIPTFFDINEKGVPEEWVHYIKTNIAEVAPNFTMKRMMDDYHERFYYDLQKRGRAVRQEDFQKAKAIAEWKNSIQNHWNQIKVQKIDAVDTDNFALSVGDPIRAEIVLHLDGIDPEHVGLEVVFFRRNGDDELELRLSQPFELIERNGPVATYSCEVNPQMSGVYEYGFRLFPKHPELPHRQDLGLVRWL